MPSGIALVRVRVRKRLDVADGVDLVEPRREVLGISWLRMAFLTSIIIPMTG